MKTKVAYFSKTGHSRKIAQAVAGELGTAALDVSEKPDIRGTDLLFIVSGIYGGKPDPGLLSFISALSPAEVKRVAFITSSKGGTRAEAARQALAETGIPAANDEYTCIGSFLIFSRKHPTEDEIQGACDFARKLTDTAVL